MTDPLMEKIILESRRNKKKDKGFNQPNESGKGQATMVEKDSSVSRPKSKSTGIVIRDWTAPQVDPPQAGKSKIISQSKHEGKNKAVESAKALIPIWAHSEPLEWEGFITESTFTLRLNT